MSSPLSDDEKAQLSARADEFHAALLQGAGTDWKPFLDGLPERVRRAVLAELVIIDLIHKWDHRQRPEVEDYLARFPELGPTDQVPPKIIVEECRCRANAGERYEVTRYRDRFPIQFPQIQSELEAIRTSTIRGGGSGTVVTPIPTSPPAASAGANPVAEQYEMVKPLGRGVFGEVWLARKKTSGIEKAIKIVTQSEEKEAGKRERRALELIKNLRHPYLLATEDFWISDHRLHIVMELADCTLRNRLEVCRESGYLGIPEGELIGYIREAAEGLDFLHSKHVVHRDVKPDNILLVHGHSKVADFGLAWEQDKAMASMRTFAGTPAYMAPEIWGKEGGPASDQYALAVTYCELRQGRPPLKSLPIHEMMFAHIEGVHDFEPFVREEERAVLAKALARVPEDRFASCMEFVEALAVALGISISPRAGSGVVAAPGSRSVPSARASNWKGSAAPAGSIGIGSLAGHPTHGGEGSGTVVEPPKRAEKPVSPPPKKSRPFATLLAIAATLLLLGTIGYLMWLTLGNGSNQQAGGTGETPTTRSTNSTNKDNGGVGGKEKGGDNGVGIKPIPIPTKKSEPKKTVDPVPMVIPPVVPPNAAPEPKSKLVKLADGREVYDWVVVRAADRNVRFRLITPSGGPRPIAPFYIMESKVWNDLYGSAINIPPDSEKNGPTAPVTGISAEDAARFAWAALGKECRLPSPDEWDYASGLYSETGRKNVTREGGRPRVMIKKPEPTFGPSAGSDINEFGLIDMAGNGREFTRLIQTKPGEPVREVIGGSTDPLAATDSVILRGRNYTLSSGLNFDTIRYEHTTPQRQLATVGSPYTSFRVVMPVPEK